MDGFEERGVLAQRRRGLQAHRTRDTRGLVGEDVAKGVLRDDNVEEARLCEHAHRGIVDEHIIGGNLRILGFHLLGNLTPQATAGQDVGLVDNGQVLLARHSHLEGYLQDALNLWTRIDIGVKGFIIVLIFLTKIHATRKLANDDKISTT